jgi:hypothetical protein
LLRLVEIKQAESACMQAREKDVSERPTLDYARPTPVSQRPSISTLGSMALWLVSVEDLFRSASDAAIFFCVIGLMCGHRAVATSQRSILAWIAFGLNLITVGMIVVLWMILH